ncbi:MAG: glycogen synthase GlgA [Erysipelotrichia bacterium]|nr:glycogen synthase GlgA [Erysipelotrichia bacterium]
MRKILFVASEGLPYIKSGGLADVIGSLPQAINCAKYSCAVVLPLYKKIKDKYNLEKINSFNVQSGLINTVADLYYQKFNEVEYYFIANDRYFYRDGMYGYVDDGERFAFFNKAVLEMLNILPFKVDILACNDWHTGMIPILCKKEYTDEYHRNIKTTYTIHNLLFQGNFPENLLDYFNLDRKYYENGDIRFDDGISFMKAGILYADKVTTVSQSYAREILTEEYSERMDGVLRVRENDLCGIVNGIDTRMWDSKTDANLIADYSVTKLSGKKKCKKHLQEMLGLRVADDVLLVGMISRLTWQKGVSLLLEKLSAMMNQDIQLIILGTGDNYIESQFKQLEYTYPHRAVFYCGYNEALSHQVYAGIDMLLMPSLFEPCGISQLIAMRYGSLPLVREVGGLKDTVIPYNEYEHTGNGFSFRNFSGDDLLNVLKYALNVYYYRPKEWKMLMKNAMNTDVSWNCSAQQYIALFDEILG